MQMNNEEKLREEFESFMTSGTVQVNAHGTTEEVSLPKLRYEIVSWFMDKRRTELEALKQEVVGLLQEPPKINDPHLNAIVGKEKTLEIINVIGKENEKVNEVITIINNKLSK